MGAAYDKGGGDETLQPLHRLYDLLLRGMVLRQIRRAQYRKAHAAGEMPGVNDRHVFKGLRRLQGILIALTDVSCHRDMDHILRLSQLFGEKSLIILHRRGLRISLSPLGDMDQQFIGIQFPLIQKTSLIRTDIVGAHGDAKLLPKGLRKIAHAVRCNQNGSPLHLLKDQDVLFNVRLHGLLADPHQLLRENAQHSRLQQNAADRLGQIAAESLLAVEKLVVAARVGGEGDHGDILTQSPRLHAQGVEALDSVHLRHHMIHENAVIVMVLCQLQTFGTA